MKEKCIAFAVSRGLVCRNILRTGVLEVILENPDHKILLLFPKRQDGVPEYLRNEFKHPRISIEEIEEISESSWSRFFWKPIVNNLVYTESTDLLAKEGSAKVKSVVAWWYPWHKRLFGFLSSRRGLKSLARKLELILFKVKAYDALFAKYKPAVLFAGSIISNYDLMAIKAAKRNGARVIAMQKGWDNLERQLIRIVPDLFLAQNSIMVTAAQKVQCFEPKRVRYTGFPQFDIYTQPERLPKKRDFMESLGLDPDSNLIFFGSEGHWTPNDDRVIDLLCQMRDQGELPGKISFILRPHFSDVQKNRYARFKGLPGIHVDDEYRWSLYFYDYWDPSRDDMIRLASDLYHASALICYASTLSLDAACLDKPIINVAFDSFTRPDGTDGTANLYKMEHYKPVVASGGVEITRNLEELKKAIIRSIHDPGYRADGRDRLRREMCGILDRNSARRVAEACVDMATFKEN